MKVELAARPEGFHAVENLDQTPYHAFRIELKLATAK